MTKNNIIAITGNIGTGKTFVSNIIAKKYGFELVNADLIGHQILKEDFIKKKISSVFGKAVFIEKEIDRKKLGKIVFSDKDKLTILNQITHPEIIKQSIDIIKKTSQTSNVLFEAAILFEASWNKFFDTTILTVCHPEEQLKRLISDRKLTQKKAKSIIETQMSQDLKISKATYVIDTTFGPKSFEKTLDLIIKDILKS